VFAVEDGGRALAAGARAARSEAARTAAGEGGALSPEAVNRIEALAYSEASALIDALGAAGSAMAVETALAGSAGPR
jgi:hypothetical protein